MDRERRDKGLYWDRAWKLVEGCGKVSAGCDYCWSESETGMRAGHPNEKIRGRAQSVIDPQSGFDGRILFREDNLDLPLRTKKPTVWALWNDLWHEDVPLDFIVRAFQTMDRARQLGHVFLVLTKRAERMAGFLEGVGFMPPDHIWRGVTAENQVLAEERIPYLLRVPGRRFLSVEPMLGPVDLTKIVLKRSDAPEKGKPDLSINCLQGWHGGADRPERSQIHAVLLGGESGLQARAMNPQWARDVRDACCQAGIPFFFKQWGEWASVSEVKGAGVHHRFRDGRTVRRVGKRRAGRNLDGCKHDDLPWGIA